MENTIKKPALNEAKTLNDLINLAQVHGKGAELEVKANENLDITDDANWYDQYGVVSSMQNMVSEGDNVLSHFSEGYQGNNLPDTFPVPYDVTRMFFEGKNGWADSGEPNSTARKPADLKAEIVQKPMILHVNISDEMISSSTDKRLKEYIEKKLAKAATQTIASMIINGDTDGMGNVNCSDATPSDVFASTGGVNDHRLLTDGGIRKNAISNSNTVGVESFDSDDIMDVVAQMGDEYQDLDDIVCLSSTRTYNSMLKDEDLKILANSSKPAIDGKSPTPWGMPLVKTPLIPLTQSDGRASSTPSSNTVGHFVTVFAPAVQWGFGEKYKMEVVREPGFGYKLIATMKVGFTIIDGANTCAAGINMTLSSGM